jgi:putative transposase
METVNEIRTGRHCVSALHVHLVFVTKYRKNVLDASALNLLKETFASICIDFGGVLLEMNGEDDHVHLLVTYPAKVSVSMLVNSLKGASSYVLRNRRKDISERYYQGVLWSPSYFCASCGGAPLSIIKEYIEKQRSPIDGRKRLISPS